MNWMRWGFVSIADTWALQRRSHGGNGMPSKHGCLGWWWLFARPDSTFPDIIAAFLILLKGCWFHFGVTSGDLISVLVMLQNYCKCQKGNADKILSFKQMSLGIWGLVGKSAYYARLRTCVQISSSQVKTWVYAHLYCLHYEEWRQGDHWGFLAISLAPGTWKDSTSRTYSGDW